MAVAVASDARREPESRGSSTGARSPMTTGPSVWPPPEGDLSDFWASMKMSKSDRNSALFVHDSPDDAPWLEGVHQLCDPSTISRFVVSRTLYRRFGRFAWWLLVPYEVPPEGHLGAAFSASRFS